MSSRNPRYKDIQLPQLRSFCLAATEGNFTATAKALGLSTSTVWQQVRSLERMFKARLLRRAGRNVELTDDGRRLLELVHPHVSGLDSLARLFEAGRADAAREMVVASGAYLSAHHLPEVIREFRERHPTVRIALRISAWAGLHRLIEREEVDVAVLAVDANIPRSPYLEYEHLFDEQLTLLIPPEHPLAGRPRIRPADLAKHPLIVPPKGGADRTCIDRWLAKHNLADRVRIAMVCAIIDVAKQCVMGGVGIALMYVTEAVARTTPGLHLKVLDPEVERLPIEMAVRRGAHLAEHVDDFRRIVRARLTVRMPSSS